MSSRSYPRPPKHWSRQASDLVAAGLTYCLENPDQAKADGYAIDSVQKMFMKLA